MLRVALSPVSLLGTSGTGLQGSILQFGVWRPTVASPRCPSGTEPPVRSLPVSSSMILVGGLNNMLHQAAGNLPFKLSQLERLT